MIVCKNELCDRNVPHATGCDFYEDVTVCDIWKQHQAAPEAGSECMNLLSLPDYDQAYKYGSMVLGNDKKLREMESGVKPVDWDTIRDRLADAYMAGVKAAT